MTCAERLRRALRRLPVDRPPVWMMRQAGRTLPEYQEVRARHDFWEICRTPELAARVSLQPVQRFAVDAAIIFSDILTIPAAMGIDVSFSKGLALSPTVRDSAAIDALRVPDVVADLGYVAGALRAVRREMGPDKGFSDSPAPPTPLRPIWSKAEPARHMPGSRS